MTKETTLSVIEQARLVEEACVRIGRQIVGVGSIEDVNWAYIDLPRHFIHKALNPEGKEKEGVEDKNKLHNEIEVLLEASRHVRDYATDERYTHFAAGVGLTFLSSDLVNGDTSPDKVQESLSFLTKENRTERVMITDAIFNDIETFHNSDGPKWEAALEVVLNATLEKETFESDDERCEFIEDFYTNPDFIQIHRFSRNGFLHHCLSYYYSATKEGGFEEHVRDYAVDDEYMYFTSGVGYAVIAQDLLGGDATGDAVREFLNFLNGIK